MVRVKNILGDDVYGLWHVKKVILQKGRQRYILIPNKETFGTKDDAEYYAHLRTRRFVERKLGRTSYLIRWRPVVKYFVTAAVMSLMTAVTVRWFGTK